MYRINVYARCTAIKMTSGLSYCLYIVVAIVLHIVSSSTAVYPDISNLTDIMDSRQFRQNMEVSKYKNNAHWMENYKYKPPKRLKTEKRPFWETNVLPDGMKKNSKGKDIEEWEEMMRKVSNERLRKWSKYDTKDLVHTEKIESVTENAFDDYEHGAESHFDASENLKNVDFKNTLKSSTKYLKNVHRGKESSSVNPLKISPMFDISDDNPIGNNPLTFQANRWGMGMNQPPKDFLEEMSESNMNHSNKSKDILKEKRMKNDDITNDVMNNVISRLLLNINDNQSNQRKIKKSKTLKEKSLNYLYKNETNDTMSELSLPPITVVSKPIKNGESLIQIFHLNEKNPNDDNDDNAADETVIKLAESKSRIFAPIFVLGPTMWITKIPKSIKQKSKIRRPVNHRYRSKPTRNIKKQIPLKKLKKIDDIIDDYSEFYR